MKHPTMRSPFPAAEVARDRTVSAGHDPPVHGPAMGDPHMKSGKTEAQPAPTLD